LVWGWSNKYYVRPERERGSGYLYPQFAVGNYEGKKLALEFYERDFTLFKPTIIIEVIGENEFLLKDYEKESISSSSERLGDIISRNYDLVFEEANLKIYKKIYL
jgi:hypothetical protein